MSYTPNAGANCQNSFMFNLMIAKIFFVNYTDMAASLKHLIIQGLAILLMLKFH